jgi:N-acetylmuramoyl-L-alanine amidase
VTHSPDDPTVLLRVGASGPAVRDLHRRLTQAGHPAGSGDRFDDHTESAVRAFQAARGLAADGVCGPQTWSALVEAGFRLGDRLLYHRRPMLRGDDVGALQRQLCALGFDAGRVDSIFGPDTEAALRDFQRNAGITTDGVCGRDTLAVLQRLGDRTDGHATVAELHQTEALRRIASHSLHGRAVAVGETGGLPALADALGQRLGALGARPLVIHHPDEHVHAQRSNEFGADAYVGVHLHDAADATAAYFAVPGYTSVGGEQLASVLRAELVAAGWPDTATRGMRLPVLRETRMPAVRFTLGPPAAVVSRLDLVTGTLVHALERWIALPVAPPAKG